MRNIITMTSLGLALLLTQCNGSGGENYSADREMAAPAMKMAAPEEGQQAMNGSDAGSAAVERKLIREGNMRFETDNVAQTRLFMDSLVAAAGGYVANENVYNYEGTMEQSISVRIPADQFDPFLSNVSSYAGKLDNRYINTMDVTEEFIDVEARLRAKKELENRYLELLKQAKTVTDLVAIEGQLSQVRSEIESMQGRLNYLQNRVSLATLSISFYQTQTEGFGFWDKVGGSWGTGWDKFLAFLVWTISLWPFVIFIIAIVVVIKIRRRRRDI